MRFKSGEETMTRSKIYRDYGNGFSAVTAFGVVPATTAAEQHYPAAVEVIAPVRTTGIVGRAAQPTPSDAAVVNVPFKSLMDEKTYGSVKEKARHDPRAEEPDIQDVIEAPQGSNAFGPGAAVATRFPRTRPERHTCPTGPDTRQER
jgi:hypothetical protein